MTPDEHLHNDEHTQADATPAGRASPLPSSASEDCSTSDRLDQKQRSSQESNKDDTKDQRSAERGGEEVEEQHQDISTRDFEAVTIVPSNRDVWTVFTPKQKRFIVFMTACGGFFSAVSANIYFPALNTLADDFHVSSSLINLTLTSYMIFQGLAPTMIGDLADMAGRRPAYIVCFTIYIGANVGLALCKNYASLFILRCVQSSGSSGTISLSTGVIADIATSSERGVWMGWATAGPMIAPALGPVLGGILSQFLGWRAIFWCLVILAALYFVPLLMFFPETGRNVVGNGSIEPQGWNMSLISYLSARRVEREDTGLDRTLSRESSRRDRKRLARARKLRFPNPLHTLRVLLEKDVAVLLGYNSIVFLAFYDLTAALPYIFAQAYGFNDLQIGLSFIPFGVGAMIAPLINGRLLDWNFRRHARKVGMQVDRKRAQDLRDFPLERARIEVAVPLALLGDAALLCYGWIMHMNAPLAAPLVMIFLVGLGFTGSFNCMSVMLVDLYPLSPSTATAANNLVRCLLGAAGTAAIVPMIDAMGRGWAYTLITGLVLLATPLMLLLERWGPHCREERRIRAQRKKEQQAALERQEDLEEANKVEDEKVTTNG